MVGAEEQILISLVRVGLGLCSPDNVSIPSDIDWDSLISLAKKHGIAPIMADGVEKMPSGTINGRRQIMRLFGSANRCELKYEQKLDVAGGLAESWHRHGLRVSLLKGFAYGRYYPNPKHRNSSDVDVYLSNDTLHHEDDNEKRRLLKGLSAGEKGDFIARKKGALVDTSEQKHTHIHYKAVSIENHHYCCGQVGDERIMELNDYLVGLLEGEPSGMMEGTCFEFPPLMFDALFYIYHARHHFLVEDGINLRHILDWVLIRKEVQKEGKVVDLMTLCERYGLRKFYDSIDGVAAYVAGEMSSENMNDAQKLMLEDILNIPQKKVSKNDSNRTKNDARFEILKTIWQNSWKYPLYSDTTVWGMYRSYAKGYLKRYR